MLTVNGHPSYVIFTGGNYYAVVELPKGRHGSDLLVGSGLRWVKAKREFAKRWSMFTTSPHYQTLTDDEIKTHLGIKGSSND